MYHKAAAAATEMEIFISEVIKETQRAAVLDCLFAGLRVGERLSLEIEDLEMFKPCDCHFEKVWQ